MDFFKLSQIQFISFPKQAESEVIPELIRHYVRGIRWEISYSEKNEIILGDAEFCEFGEKEYVIHVTKKGSYIAGKDYASTIRGFLTFLEMIFVYGKYDYRIECVTLKESPMIRFRSVHICLFPEYSFESIKRVIRTCAISKYTHILLESWGSIKLDTLKELSWSQAFTKDQIRELVQEANILGMKVIPFFQHLGHASLARLGYSGKHVLLDQNPDLEYLYYPKSYGWVWNFKSREVKELLKNVREELIELFGDAEYFHIGCDESGMEFDSDELSEYLNEISAHLKSKGRRTIIWGDMLLSHDFFQNEKYECNSTREYAQTLLNKLDKDMIIADWQYNTIAESWSSSKLIKQYGFDVICCPWDEEDNLNSSISTTKKDEHYGVMKTTWDRLFAPRGIMSIIYYGLMAYRDSSCKRFEGHVGLIAERAHSIYRKVATTTETYELAGWSEKQV